MHVGGYIKNCGGEIDSFQVMEQFKNEKFSVIDSAKTSFIGVTQPDKNGKTQIKAYGTSKDYHLGSQGSYSSNGGTDIKLPEEFKDDTIVSSKTSM